MNPKVDKKSVRRRNKSQESQKGGRIFSSLASLALFCGYSGLCFLGLPARAENLHFTYMWHLEQPIYWPDQQASGADRYERAWESLQHRDAGAAHPQNDLREIFGKDDRVAVYQYRARDAINSIRGYAEAGAQISYSGGLIENIFSLGGASQLGYSPSWYNSLREARGWTTNGASKPRCDIVVFPFHHPLLPLCDDSTIRKEIQLYKSMYPDAWGSSPGVSHGLFPSEMAFSERVIPMLAAEGITWVFVSGEKMSRACTDYPLVLGSGGVNCDPPNAADQLNPAQTNYYRVSISRGCAPAEAYPFAYTPHRAQYVNPDTGAISQIIAVPCAQAVSWEDGYAAIGTGHFNNLQTHNDASRPMLVVLAHDGDNAWGGGYSYYMEAVPNLVSSAQSSGYTATVVEEYLADHPVPANDVVHIEDGAWVNADGDFGSPVMLNWNWPLVNASGQIDIAAGWAEDERNWAVITAAQNRVDTAEQIAGSVNIRRVLYPDGSTTHAERAWHYFLGSLNSGYMYYGTSVDMEVKPTIACNEAVEHADAVIGNGSADATPPTIWIPQRHPWNPGSLNFGPQYRYQQYQSNGDFWVWTFAHDVSGIASVTLKYRLDNDGTNPLASAQNETYAGGSEVGAWQSLAMTYRQFPKGNVLNDASIDFFELPTYIADEYYVQVTGIRSKLVDYYVEAVDTKGNVRRSPIQHVYVGAGNGSTPSDDVVTVAPNPPVAGTTVTISYKPAGRPLASATQVYLHCGFNQWNPVASPDAAMTWSASTSTWDKSVSVPSNATQLDCVFNNGAGTWDSNGGADWHFTVSGGTPTDQWDMDGVRDADSTQVATNNGMHLWAGLKGNVLYVACEDAGEGNDHFILLARTPGAMRSAPWAKAGTVATWDAYLADENDNSYTGWFDTTAATQSATGANGGVLEGTINLVDEFGTLPTTIYLAVALYPTADGSTLAYGSQIPASTNSNGNIEAAEYVAVNLCALGGGSTATEDFDHDCDVDLDDFSVFQACLTAPGVAQTLSSCQSADLDGDTDVDQADFGIFQLAYSAGA
jgi:hypothetical protein